MPFEVSFDPELPDHGAIPPPENVNRGVAYGAADDQPDHNLRYVISGTPVCYYPAGLPTLLGDLLGELEGLESGRAHGVSMSGYTLLLAEITGDNVTFRDPGLMGTWWETRLSPTSELPCRMPAHGCGRISRR
jgi:hypothetical protein